MIRALFSLDCYNGLMKTIQFHDIAIHTKEEAIALLSSATAGLSSSVVTTRILDVGRNEVLGKEVGWQQILLRQFKSAFIYLLLVATLISFFLGERLDAFFILLFLVVNAALGFFQEYRAENALQSLKNFVDRKTRVRRDNKIVSVSVSQVVPGDIVILDAGDMIPADGYFLRAESVTVDESPMTGETEPVAKTAGPLQEAPADFYGATNIGFSRTTLLSGDAELLIFATGKNTEVGAIAKSMQEAESPSAFEEGIGKFSRFILKLVFATLPIIFVLNFIIHKDTFEFAEFLLFSIALTVSVIPEALPLVTTLSLSRGALELAKRHVVPRRLSAIEDLGSINILATDKTGTITENKLSVSSIWGEETDVLHYALMGPLSDIHANEAQNSVFDKALLHYVSPTLTSTLKGIKRIDALPFDPIRRRSTILVEQDGKAFLMMRGAPEVVFAATKKKMTVAAKAWAEEQGRNGSRTLAIAYKEVIYGVHKTIEEKDESGFMMVGMIAFADPLKPSTKQAVLHANKLGVRVKIITGDSREVAGWVGYQAGIIMSQDDVITGEELEKLSPEAKLVAVEKYHVFARTMPLQKYEIIQLLQKNNLVGFLGEGFNDAPALKLAHVGLAVENASDIAQDASDVVLLNPSLEVIIDGIKEGRKIFANSMKYLRATLASNFGNFFALAFASLFIPYLPMLPIQILLLNLLSDFPMISIATDNVDDEELQSPKGYQVAELTSIAIVLGVVSTIFDFSFFGYFVQFDDPAVLQTMWFIGSILTELILLFSIRTALPFWKAKRPANIVMWLTGAAALFTLTIAYLPLGEEVFGFVYPEMKYMSVAIGLVALYFVSTEAIKLLFYRFWRAKDSRYAGLVR